MASKLRLILKGSAGSERPYELGSGTYSVGAASPRDGIKPDVDLAPFDPNHWVSRQHARLTVSSSGEVTLTDAGSANGTALNGRLMASAAPATLSIDDEIVFGHSVTARVEALPEPVQWATVAVKPGGMPQRARPIEGLPSKAPSAAGPAASTIECPFCREPIVSGAAKCKHCQTWLDEARRPRSDPRPAGMGHRPMPGRSEASAANSRGQRGGCSQAAQPPPPRDPPPKPPPAQAPAAPASIPSQREPAQRVEVAQDRPMQFVDAGKSLVGPAFLCWVLYYVGCYVVGLVMNFMYLADAKKHQALTGHAPSGSGCLWLLLFIHFILPIIAGIILGLLLLVGAVQLADLVPR